MPLYACSPVDVDGYVYYGLVVIYGADSEDEAREIAFKDFRKMFGDKLKDVVCEAG